MLGNPELLQIISCVVLYATTVGAVSKNCHPGTGRCFWVTKGHYSRNEWLESRAICGQDGGDLATMETEELWNYFTSTFT